MSARSLRRRLLFLLLASTGLIWLGTASYSYFDTRYEIGVLLDAHLAQAASLLTAQLGAGSLGEDSETTDEEADDGGAFAADRFVADHRFDRQVIFQVWREGRLLLRSATAPRHRLSDQAEGFSDVRDADIGWRAFSHRGAQRELLIQVGERSQLREHLASQMSEHLLHPLRVALPLLGILIWVSVGRGLAPLATIGRQLDARAPDHLEALDAAAAPREAAPLIDTLNALFSRVAATLENERQFTADAARPGSGGTGRGRRRRSGAPLDR